MCSLNNLQFVLTQTYFYSISEKTYQGRRLTVRSSSHPRREMQSRTAHRKQVHKPSSFYIFLIFRLLENMFVNEVQVSHLHFQYFLSLTIG